MTALTYIRLAAALGGAYAMFIIALKAIRTGAWKADPCAADTEWEEEQEWND